MGVEQEVVVVVKVVKVVVILEVISAIMELTYSCECAHSTYLTMYQPS